MVVRTLVPDVFIYVMLFGSPTNPVKLLFLSYSYGHKMRAPPVTQPESREEGI